jgi:hypothetical protein
MYSAAILWMQLTLECAEISLLGGEGWTSYLYTRYFRFGEFRVIILVDIKLLEYLSSFFLHCL